MRRILVTLLLVAGLFAAPATAPARDGRAPAKQPTAVGTGGAAATVDPLATQAAIDTLRHGGNPIDAAGAPAGVLGGGGAAAGGGRPGRRGAVLVRHRRRRLHEDLPGPRRHGPHDRLARDGARR